MEEFATEKREIRFCLFAQNTNGDLIIKNLQQNNFFIRTSREILNDPTLLAGFTEQQIAFLKKLNNSLGA